MIDASELEYYTKTWNLKISSSEETATGLLAFTPNSVLKIATPQSDEQTAVVLQHYDGKGAVRLLQHAQHVTLCERSLPGVSLINLATEDDSASTHIICNIINKLHSNKNLADLTHIKDLQRGFTRYLDHPDPQIPLELVIAANDTYSILLNSQATPIVLHGDLHHGNILYDETRGWLAIDPKGYIGEPAYEVGAMLRNPVLNIEYFISPAIIKQRVAIITEQLGLDPQRIISWAFAQSILAAIWCVEDGLSPDWALAAGRAFAAYHKR